MAGAYTVTASDATPADGVTGLVDASDVVAFTAVAPGGLAFGSVSASAAFGQGGSATPTLTNNGGAAITYSLAVTGFDTVPNGLSIDSSTGQVSWTAQLAVGTYPVVVTAANSAGTTTASFQVVIYELPSVPGNVVATPLNAAIQITWQRPERDGTSPITGYRVQYSLAAGDTSWVQAPDVSGREQLSDTITGLSNDGIYRVRVAAVSSLGTGPYSLASAPIVLASPVPEQGASSLPEPEMGEVVVQVGGTTASATINIVQDTIFQVATGGAFSLNLKGLDQDGAAIPIDSSALALRLQQGTQVRVSGDGFYPQTVVTVFLFSNPRQLGQVQVDANGNYDALLPVPLDIEWGRHTLQANGVATDGNNNIVKRSVSLPVLLKAGPAVVSTSSFALSSTTLVADGRSLAVLELTVRDTLSNPVSGASVFFSTDLGEFSEEGPWITNDDGKAIAVLTSTVAGTASVVGYLGTDTTGTRFGSGSVTFMPGYVDAARSSVSASDSVAAADGKAQVTIEAVLRDAQGNVVPRTRVELLQGESRSMIDMATRRTDEFGEVRFVVRSDVADTVTYTMRVLDEARPAFTLDSSATVIFAPVARLEFMQEVSDETPALGDTVTVRYEVRNTGSGPSKEVVLQSGILMPRLEITEIVSVSEGTTLDLATGVWTIPSVPAGGSVVLEVQAVARPVAR